MSWYTKNDLIVFPFVVLQMRMRGPLFEQQTCVFCLKLPQGLHYISANSKGSGPHEPLQVAYVTCTIFLCAVSNVVKLLPSTQGHVKPKPTYAVPWDKGFVSWDNQISFNIMQIRWRTCVFSVYIIIITYGMPWMLIPNGIDDTADLLFWDHPISLAEQGNRWAELNKNMSLSICEQRRPRSACASTQSDQGLHCSLTESMDTIESINGEQKPGWDFAHAWDESESAHFAHAWRHLFAWRCPDVFM